MPVLNIAYDAWSSVVSAFKAAGKGIAGALGIGSLSDAAAVIDSQAVMFNDWVNTAIWAGVRQSGYWNAQLHPAALNMRQDILKAFGDTSASLNRTVDVIIPNSVKAGTHKVWQGVGSAKQFAQKIETQVFNTNKRLDNVQATNKRQDFYINKQLLPFMRLFTKYYQTPLQILIDWVAAPALLSAKLTPTITPDIVAQLGRKAGRRQLDLLARELLGHAPSLVNVIDRTAVAVLSSGKYDVRR